MKLQALALGVVSFVCGCEARGRDVTAVEPNDLGITLITHEPLATERPKVQATKGPGSHARSS